MDLGRADRGERRGGNNDQPLSADGDNAVHRRVRRAATVAAVETTRRGRIGFTVDCSANGGHEQVRLTNNDGTTYTEDESVLVHHDPADSGHGIVAGPTSPFSGEGRRLVVVVPRGTDRTTPSVIRLHRVERRR